VAKELASELLPTGGEGTDPATIPRILQSLSGLLHLLDSLLTARSVPQLPLPASVLAQARLLSTVFQRAYGEGLELWRSSRRTEQASAFAKFF